VVLPPAIADWHRLDERIEALSAEITALAKQEAACARLMTVPGIGPIIYCRCAMPNANLTR
jgi:transposase